MKNQIFYLTLVGFFVLLYMCLFCLVGVAVFVFCFLSMCCFLLGIYLVLPIMFSISLINVMVC